MYNFDMKGLAVLAILGAIFLLAIWIAVPPAAVGGIYWLIAPRIGATAAVSTVIWWSALIWAILNALLIYWMKANKYL